MSVTYSTAYAPAPRAQRLAVLAQCLLQRLEMPVILLDGQGAILEANPVALRRIERCEGLWLDAGGRLAVRQGGRWVPVSKWQPQIASGLEVTLDLEAEDGAPHQLHLRPVQADETREGGAWVMATIDRMPLARTDAMRRRFRFTRTQARLAEMLCEGMRPTHAAEALGVKISTIRTHVGQMYEKTGTHTQAQLVALLHAV